MSRYLALIFIATLLVSSGLSAQEPNGQELFKVHCQTCHGPQGRGDGPAAQALEPPPRDLAKRPYKQGCGPGAIVRTLQTGVPESAMPSFSDALSVEEMWALSHYVRSLQGGCCQE